MSHNSSNKQSAIIEITPVMDIAADPALMPKMPLEYTLIDSSIDGLQLANVTTITLPEGCFKISYHANLMSGEGKQRINYDINSTPGGLQTTVFGQNIAGSQEVGDDWFYPFISPIGGADIQILTYKGTACPGMVAINSGYLLIETI